MSIISSKGTSSHGSTGASSCGLDPRLLCDALSAITDTTVVPWTDYEEMMETSKGDACRGPLSMGNVFGFANRQTSPVGFANLGSLSVVNGPAITPSRFVSPAGDTVMCVVDLAPARRPSGRQFPVIFCTLTGCNFRRDVVSTDKVCDLKGAIEPKCGIEVAQQHWVFNGKPLGDWETVEDCGLYSDCNIEVLIRLPDGEKPVHGLSPYFTDPQFDFDFRNLSDVGAYFSRGFLPYQRPLGFMRYALKVIGEYDSDDWLGEPGSREESCPGEWPVSYHGTDLASVKLIVEEGYRVDKGERFKYGKGIYSTPTLDAAAAYAKSFYSNHKRWEVIMQNRVNPFTVDKVRVIEIAKESRFYNKVVQFWVTPHGQDIRPYGVCIREKP